MSWANSRVGATQKRSSSCAIFHKHRLFEARQAKLDLEAALLRGVPKRSILPVIRSKCG
jgi:hypothetical protein